MADIRLAKPAAGTTQTIPSAPDGRFIFDFPADAATLTRSGDNLVLTFEDGASIQLQGFYTTYSKEEMPSFQVDGVEISGQDFFAALGEDLMPAAGPAASSSAARGGRYNEYGGSDLLDGIDHLGRLDVGFDGGVQLATDTVEPSPWYEGDGWVDHGVTVTPLDSDAAAEVVTVHEAGLANGTTPGAADAPVSAGGSLIINAPDGVAAIVISGILLKKTRMFAGDPAPFVMELPQYHLPTVKNVLLSMWERVRSYVVKAGTIIFLSSMVIWFLLNFGFYEGSFGLLDPEVDDYIQYSLMAGLGNLLAWIFAPLGFGNWESTVTSITGLVAKENVVATVGVITSLGEEIGETDPSLWASFAAMLGGSSAAIMAFCAFNLLCAPCFAAIGTIRRQMMSAKWTWAAIGYMCAFAWCVGLMIYQFGGLIAGEIAFGPFTALAVVVAAGMLYLLFRPAAKPKGAGKLETASKNA